MDGEHPSLHGGSGCNGGANVNVLILPAGSTQASRRLVLGLHALLGDVADSSPRLDREPPRQGDAADWRWRSALADTVEIYRGVVQMFIRCIGEEAGPVGDPSPPNLLARRRTFWGEDAWHNLARWVRQHSDADVPSWEADVAMDLEWVVRDAKHGDGASLIDIASLEWVDRNGGRAVDDAQEQRRLQSEVAGLVGSLHGGDPNRAEQASERVRDMLAAEHDR